MSTMYNTLFIDGEEKSFDPRAVLNLKENIIDSSCSTVYRVNTSNVIQGGTMFDMAMKVIKDEPPKQGQKPVDFEQEIRLLHQARDCDEIVQFLGAVKVESHYYVFMELMSMNLVFFYENIPRKEIVRDQDGKEVRFMQDEDLLAHIAISMARGLLFLKETLGTVHSDIKPPNVLINGKGQVKIADLGIAKLIRKGQEVSEVSTNTIMTAKYSAPERGGRYRGRSDVWSMGLTLYEVATGMYFYTDHDMNTEGISKRIRENDAPVLSKRQSGYSLPLCTFISSCMVKDVERRNNINDMMKMKFCVQKNTEDEREKGRKKMEEAIPLVMDNAQLRYEDMHVDIPASEELNQ